MKDIVDSIKSKVYYLEDVLDMEIVNITADLLVGTTNTKSIFRNLDKSWVYKFHAVGDRRISELEVVIYHKRGNKWETVGEESGKNPEITIYPEESGLYEFVIRVAGYNLEYSAGHFATFLYHDDPLKK